MDTIQAARQVILDAEVSLRDLISTALANQRYGEVKEIADLADRVAQLISGNDIQLSVSTPAEVNERLLEERQHTVHCPLWKLYAIVGFLIDRKGVRHEN